MKEKLVLIGNGMAGMRTVEELLSLAPDRYDITVFGAEPYGNYNRILLSPVLAGEKKILDIMIHPLEWYEEHGITLFTGNPVVNIDRHNKQVTAAQGQIVAYDTLMLATGSDPMMIPFPGHNLNGVVAFRDIKDVQIMMDAAQKAHKAVVIGGGLLGLEAAAGLIKQGMDVTVVHLMDILMERQLDPVAAAMLKNELENKGIKFAMATATEAILGNNGKVNGIRFKDGTELETDLVVMAVGVRPNIALAKAAALTCDRGVIVDDTLKTSDPHIVAVGECVQHRGMVYGLVAPLYEQGKVLARHLAGVEDPGLYSGSSMATRLKVSGVDLFSAGDFAGDAETEEILFNDPSRKIYKKLVIRNQKLQGAVLVGDTEDGPWLLDLIRQQRDISDLRDFLTVTQSRLAEAMGPKAAPPAWAITSGEICGCNGVRKQQIVDTILEKGLTTLDEVRLHTKASSSCGSCTGMVEQIIAQTLGADYVAPKVKPLCGCTEMTHDQVRDSIKIEKLTSITMAMKWLQWKTPDGCPACRQSLNYYIHALWPAEHQEEPQSRFINERVHANIQKDGTYSVIPRIWGGITTPDQLRAIANVVDKFNIPEVKFTGGQRLTMLGVKKEQLPAVWAELEKSDLVSGHAYGKAMRTVKTCVGDTWCRFGTQNSEKMGIQLEEMVWNVWTPHKYKLAVSGCPRNCAEATIKDFGVVAVDSGWELHVGGNGGIKVRVTDLLTKVKTMEEVKEYAGAFLQLYREEARYLERTAPWIERVGIAYVRTKIVDDEKGRKLLYQTFLRAHEGRSDPWKDRAVNGVSAHEFVPMSTISAVQENAA